MAREQGWFVTFSYGMVTDMRRCPTPMCRAPFSHGITSEQAKIVSVEYQCGHVWESRDGAPFEQVAESSLEIVEAGP